MNHAGELTADEQTARLAERYSQRAPAYDSLWSPVIRPAGERLVGRLSMARSKAVIDVGTGTGALLPAIHNAAPNALVVGVDRSQGMLRLAKEKHSGPLVLMDVQNLAVPDNGFDTAVVAFVLFHLPHPERCLAEVNRVLRSGGEVGTVTWGSEDAPPAYDVWNEELQAAGAHVLELPAVDNRACCDSGHKMTTLLEQAGFGAVKVWTELIEHRWRPDDYFDYQVRSASRLRLLSLADAEREVCLQRIRERLSRAGNDSYLYRGEVLLATAVKGATTRESMA
jgi:ubiquinone/menaquinone biosynthesis C-methylase UbiE